MNGIKYGRISRDWNQKKLSARAQIHQPMLSQMERGNILPGPEQRKRLARILNIPEDKLTEEVPDDIFAEPADLAAEK